jgi:hypothetical protein
MSEILNKITITGFKSIRELNNFELKNLNILIGANGAGKSNLIDYFRMLRNIIDGKLDDFIRLGGGISDFLFNGRKTTSEMKFKMHFGFRGYRFRIKPGPLDNCLLTNEAHYYEHSSTDWWELGNSPDGNPLLLKEVKEKSAENQYSLPVYNAISSWQIYHFHDTSATAAMHCFLGVGPSQLYKIKQKKLIFI